MDARSTVSDGDGDFDKRSIASTGTTASLASRIASLAVDFEPKLRGGITEGDEDFTPHEEDEDRGDGEEVVEVTEEQLMQELDRQEPAFQVCSRLFHSLPLRSTVLQRITYEQAESFQRKGFVVVDGFLSQDIAARLHAETVFFKRQGRLQEACNIGIEGTNGHRDNFTERTARGDYICWLHPGTPPATSPSFVSLLTAFQELQDDLAHVLNLRKRFAEYQLSYYGEHGAQYVRHRDAFPDDGSEKDQRRVTAIVYANPNWRREDGGKLRMWPPHTDSNAVLPEHADAEQSHPNAGSQGLTSRDSYPSSSGAEQALPNGGPPNGYLPNGHAHVANGTAHLARNSDPSSAGSTSLRAAEEHPGHDGGFVDAHGVHVPGARSPRSATSSVFVEPTEASSNQDNTSVDGASVKSGSRSERPGQGTRAAVEEVGTAAVVDVAPVAGRLVIFLSGVVEHAVLPNFAERVAITAWCQ